MRTSLISGTIKTTIDKSNMTFIMIKQATKQGYIPIKELPAIFDASYPTSELRRGRVQGGGKISPALTISGMDGLTVIEPINTTADGCAGAVLASYYKDGTHNICDSPQPRNGVKVYTDETGEHFRIRKLTQRECFRLMGVRDEDIDKIQSSGVSRSQQYKMAGNSIVCDVLMAIFEKMFVNPEPVKGQQLKLF